MIIEQEKLDDLEEIKILDPSEMWKRMKRVPEQIMSAGDQVSNIVLPAQYRTAKAVVFAGMGGSAVAGDFVQSVLAAHAAEFLPEPMESNQNAVPIFVVSRSHSLPSWVDETTLVFISSYSGNTFETLACFEDAVKRAAMIIVLTSGGKLQEKAASVGVPVFDVGGFVDHQSSPKDAVEPRTTVMASFVGSLGMLCKLDLVSWQSAFGSKLNIPKLARWAEGFTRLYEPLNTRHNFAKELATRLAGKIVVIYGGDELDSVARRWKTQINENADSWAFAEVLPDANHNAVNGYRVEGMTGNVEVVLLSHTDIQSPENTKLHKLQELFRSKGVSVHPVSVESQLIAGENIERMDERQSQRELDLWLQPRNYNPNFPTEEFRKRMRRMLDLQTPVTGIIVGTCLGDWVSYYMALLTGVDPSPVPHITELKDVP